ncbi:esterase, partial [Achromobacter xylosoxidans]
MQRRLLNALLIALLVSFGLHGGPTQAQAQSTPKMQSGE